MLDELIIQWRNEIKTDLAAEETQLATAEKALVAAESAAAAAKRHRREMADAIRRLPANVPLTGELAARIRSQEATFARADAALLRAKNGVIAARAKVEGLEEALQQLAALIPAEVAETT